MKNLFVILCLISSVASAQSQTSRELIQVNQVGYYPSGPKIAVYTGTDMRNDFSLVTGVGDTVFRGKLMPQRNSTFSSTKTQLADFSSFNKPGDYAIVINGVGKSYAFSIREKVHSEVLKASIKAFYYHRVSEALLPEFAGKWSRPSGHPDTAVLIHPSAASEHRPSGTVISSPGGWYDAGDYNKYIVNSGITMGTMLAAYEDFKRYYDTLNLNIPESGNAIPDLLDELKYNLDWMLTMQDPNDGGVYHKCTNASFDGMVMPGVTKAPRYVVQKGTAAALDFAAVMAQASRVYKALMPAFADTCLNAAKFAWNWAIKNPDLIYDQDKINTQYEPKISTGAYGDRNFKDEWFWAASELFVTTSGKEYLSTIRQGANDSISIPSWSNVRMPGVYSMLRHKKTVQNELSKELIAWEKSLIEYADRMILKSKQNAFATIMGQGIRDFIWGSNSVAANQSILLLNAYLLTGKRTYFDHSISNLDYILGRNATGFCFVTGFGTKSTMNPHHRPSVADGIKEPVPGFLAGGPNPGRQDKCKYEHTEPETAYVDHDCSYASNEVAINWNAPLVYVLGGIESRGK